MVRSPRLRETASVLHPDRAPIIEGTCLSSYEPVREAFASNFTLHSERGAAVCVVIDGRVVVDLWGGWADLEGTVPWSADTLVNAFSIGKGVVALLAAQLVGEGALDVDRAVAEVWPEFAAGGKGNVTVRQLLSHQAGLPALHERLPDLAMYDWRAMTAALAAETPWWEPGTAHGYHVNTFGFLIGEVLRRVTGASVGQLVRDRVARPLGADLHLGLSAAEHRQIASWDWGSGMPDPATMGALTGDSLMRFNTYFNPSGASGAGVVNTPEWRAAEIPSTNMHATARGVARLYAALANGGELDGVRVVDEGALRAAVAEQVYGPDRVLDRPTRFGLGFQLTQPERPLGAGDRAFGHFGAGGSLGFCDPDRRLAMGYVMNTMGERWQNPRNRALIDALDRCG